MSQIDSEQPAENNGTRTTLWVLIVAIVAVVILFMLYSHLPRANTSAGTSSDLVTPTPGMTHPVSSIALNRVVVVDGVSITIMQVQQASDFTDLKKHTSPYTLRIYIQTHNGGQEPIGINFNTDTHLLLPDGSAIKPNLISVSPVTMPKATQVGYLDFPLQNKAQLSDLMLRFNNNTTVSFVNQ